MFAYLHRLFSLFCFNSLSLFFVINYITKNNATQQCLAYQLWVSVCCPWSNLLNFSWHDELALTGSDRLMFSLTPRARHATTLTKAEADTNGSAFSIFFSCGPTWQPPHVRGIIPPKIQMVFGPCWEPKPCHYSICTRIDDQYSACANMSCYRIRVRQKTPTVTATS